MHAHYSDTRRQHGSCGHRLIQPREDSAEDDHLLLIVVGPQPIAQLLERHSYGECRDVILPILSFPR
jgi:hypothetical protein